MRHVDGVYTQRFNRQHNYDGQLFRGRYKSILVGGDSYLLELVRYIHRNPLKGGLVKRLDSYRWSSHKGYLSSDKKWGWLHKEYFLSLFSSDKASRRRAYINFVSTEESEEIKQIFTRKKLPSILGTEGFINWVKEKYYKGKLHGEVPESRVLAPNADKIKEAVCNSYGVEIGDLMVTRRRIANEPRNVAIYLVRRYTGATLESIGKEFNMNTYSSVGSVIERMRMQILKDKRLRKRLAELEKKLIMSQEQI
jgi:hypothetical protein